MIKLKDLLMEDWIEDKWYPAHTKKTIKRVLFHKDVPIYPKSMERIIGKIPITSFHVTTLSHLENVKKLLGSKKSFSTFTRAGRDSQLAKGKGIQTDGGVVFWLEGILLARNYIDLQSVPDKTGRRWISSQIVFDDPMLVKSAAKRKKIPDYEAWKNFEWDTKDEMMEKHGTHADNTKAYEKEVKEILNKRASEVIADYIDLTNKLLKKHKKLVKKNLATPATKGSIWWNEILIYDAKIKEIFVMSRVAKDLDWSTTERGKLEKLASLATGNDPITVGTPSKYRKWYTDRKGVFDDI